jgi:predicted PurR-regulated permease PerM
MMPDESRRQQRDEKSYSQKVWIAGGIFAFIIVFLLLFKTLFSILLLAFAGVLIAVFFHGFAGLLQRYLHLPQKLSVFVSVIFNLLLIVAFFWFTGARLQQQIAELSDTLPQTVQQAKGKLESTTIGSKLLEQLQSHGSTQKTRKVIQQFFSSTFGVLSDIYIVLLIGLFFTAQPSVYKRGLIKLLPSKAQGKGKELIEDIGNLLKKWIKGQIFGIAFIAVLTGIGLWIIGLPMVFTLALIAGLLNFIPNFGPLIALVPAVLIAFSEGTTTALIVIGMYTGIQIIQSAVEQPLIQKRMINIPPAMVIIGQVAMGILGGFWGVLLAAPIVGILMTVVNKLWVDTQR